MTSSRTSAWTPQPPSAWQLLTAAVWHRFDFNAMNRDMAVGFAQRRSPEQLVDELRRYADLRRKPVVTTMDNLLFDTLVHVQDVAIPLGIEHSPAEPAITPRSTGSGRWAGRSTPGDSSPDCGWSPPTPVDRGRGHRRGPRAGMSLLLLMTGRAAALGQLDGPGAAELRSRQSRSG